MIRNQSLLTLEFNRLRLAFRAERWRLALVAVLIVSMGMVGYLLWPRSYLGESVVLPATRAGQSALAAGLLGRVSALGISLGGLGAEGDVKAEALALLKSRTLIEPFLVEEKVLEHIFPDGYLVSQTGKPSSLPTMADGYERFIRRMLKVSEDPRSGLIRVAVKWRDPELAAHWSASIVDRVNALMRERAISEAEGNLAFLYSELERMPSVDVRQAIASLIESELKSKMLANVRPEFALRFIERAMPPDVEHYSSPSIVVVLLLVFVALIVAIASLIWLRLVAMDLNDQVSADGT